MKITGIEKIDEVIDGLSRSDNILIIADPGIDISMIGIQIAYNFLSQGYSCLFIVTNKSVKEIIDLSKESLFNLNLFKDKIEWIDCFSPTYGLPSQYEVANVEEESFFEKVKSKVKEKQVIIFDSVSTVIDFHLDKGIDKLIELEEYCKEKENKRIYLFVNWLEDKAIVEKLEKRLGKKVVKLKGIVEKALLRKYLIVDSKKIPIKISFPSGLSIHIPKILVTGPFHSGKSTVVRKLSDKAISIDRLGTTIALDHGYAERKGIAVELFGTPGQARFDWILNILAKDIYGALFIVDSTNPSSFPRAKEMLAKIESYGIPIVIVANKQDLPNAISVEEIKKKLNVKYPVVGAVAIKGEGLNEALEKLIDLMVG